MECCERGWWCPRAGGGGPGPTHLPSAVAALPSQVLPMHQGAGGPAALQGQPRVDERRGARVVVHKESLQRTHETEPINTSGIHYV